MNLKLKFLVSLCISMFVFASCNSDKTSTETKVDTSGHSSHDTATTSGHDDHAAGTDTYMSGMHAMMEKMKAMTMTGDFDVDFANMMIEHHKGAVTMSEKLVREGKDEKVKSMAQAIIANQTKEIQELQDFVKNYKPSGMKHGEGELQKCMTETETKMMPMQMTGDADKDYVAMMIPHHQCAIDMSKKELANGMSKELKKMAQKAINDQGKEIKEFKSWLESHK